MRRELQLDQDDHPGPQRGDQRRPTWEHPGGYGWNGLDTELQWQALCIPDAEFMFKVGFDIILGRNRHGNARRFRRAKHLLSVGGFWSRLRNAAARSQIPAPFRDHRRIQHVHAGTGLYKRQPQRVHVQLGVHPPIQPAVLQLARGAIDNDFLKHLIPVAEFAFQTPIYNGGRRTDDHRNFQPGVIYIADKWQIALEAMIPMTGATGHGVGVVGSLDFYLDDIFPNTIDKPIFPNGLA